MLSRNVDMINSAKNFLEWQVVTHMLHTYLVSIACLQETNTQWKCPILHHIWQIFASLPTKIAKIATSNSKNVPVSNYQLGGTCTITIS